MKKINGFLKKAMFDISQTNCPKEEYEKRIAEKVMPKSLEESQDKKVDFLFYSLKKHLIEEEKLKVVEEELDKDLKGYVTSENKIALNKDNTNLQNIKTLIHEYTHYKLHLSRESELKRYQKEIEAESTVYLVCSNFGIDTSDYSFNYINIYGAENTLEDLYNSYQNICAAANEINKVLEEALRKELINTLESGDIAYANLEFSDNNEDAKRLIFIIDKKGDKYEAFNITSEEKPYITSIKLKKDSENNLAEDSIIKMNVKYLVDKKDIISKVGHAANEDLSRILKYKELFSSKNIIKEFSSNPVPVLKMENTNGLDFSLKQH